jgi:signal transduction histidine kinase
MGPGPRLGRHVLQALGRRAATLGLSTLDLVRIHEQALAHGLPPISATGNQGTMARRAAAFFAAVITPLEEVHHTAVQANIRLEQIGRALGQQTKHLSASNQRLKAETARRRLAEASLRKSELHYRMLLEQSQQMQEQLRLLSRQLLTAQEEERKRISRELHDVIAQTLTSINLRLTALRKEATLNRKGIEESIERTQELVEDSVNIVHRFARELRPTVLDDLGLIPALHSYMKTFRAETGIQVSLSAPGAVEKVNEDKRTVLYRVVQEALANTARHAQATQAEVEFEVLNGAVAMRIRDNGKGFQMNHAAQTRRTRRLGLLGMKERLEMVGGNFKVSSEPGKGTTIFAQIPLMNMKRPTGRNAA